jgi:beta-N-acetylhexosaminidase
MKSSSLRADSTSVEGAVVSATGRLVIGGFAGTRLPRSFATALKEGRRGGAIVFKHNVAGDLAQIAALVRELHAASTDPILVGVDQEGGRVARIGAPLLRVPAMRTVASWGDTRLAERIARAVGDELAALGMSIVFAPVLDVSTRASNPVIGDRAFGDDADICARFGVAWIHGLQAAGVLACGKHFPGHGDTTRDSHVDLPVVDQPRERLDAVELVPFRAAAAAGVAAMMTAHVVYSAVDPLLPATLSKAACTGLREAIAFAGMLVSDDLEMQAIAARFSIEEAAVQAIAAGCDALLVCHDDEKQDRAASALAREAERSPAFRARCAQALHRIGKACARSVPRSLDDEAIGRVVGGPGSSAVAGEIARRLAG